MKLNLAVVSFLNTIPLVEWFCRNDKEISLVRALPSELSPMLSDGSADIGLLPVADVFRGKSAGFFSGTCIGCQGAVDSVKFFSSTKLENLKFVHADRGSRSSVALLKILLKELYGVQPEFSETRPVPGSNLDPGVGVLVIGDLCFQFEKALVGKNSICSYDLGQMWNELTGLPFVFAVWAAGKKWLQTSSSENVVEAKDLLNHARKFGVSIVPELAQREAQNGRLGYQGESTKEAIEHYFQCSLNYELAEKQMQGIKEFHRLCLKHGVISNGDFPPVL